MEFRNKFYGSVNTKLLKYFDIKKRFFKKYQNKIFINFEGLSFFQEFGVFNEDFLGIFKFLKNDLLPLFYKEF